MTRSPLALAALFLLPALLPAQKHGSQKPGTTDRTIEIGGKQREYRLHIPRGYKKQQKQLLPLVLMLHGRTSNGKAASSRYYGWTQLADKEKFFAVFPTALGSPTSWQGSWAGARSDDKFLATLIDAMLKEFRIDKDRVFMTGHSSGGFMSFSFASSHADKVAAIGPVAGLNLARNKPKAPVAVISFHGMADNVVAYDSERGKNARYKGMPSAIESAARVAKHNGCKKKPVRKSIMKGKVHVDTWSGGKADVVLYSIEGGNHGWPNGRRQYPAATKLIWEFFKQHGRGQKKSQKKSRRKRTK